MPGFEVAGVVLAIIPIIVNQLDNYVQGIETLKTLNKRRYRVVFKSYLTDIETQRALLLNTLEQVLEGVVDYDDEIAQMINNPTDPAWQDEKISGTLQLKLGRDYKPFIDNMAELAGLLSTICQKLGLNDHSLEAKWDDSSALLKKLKKFKHILSKSVYNDMLSKMERMNCSLQSLVEQANEREKNPKKRLPKRQLVKYRDGKRYARSLYNAIIRGKCWKCACRENHIVYMQLGADNPISDPNCSDDEHPIPRFTMTIDLALRGKCANESSSWKQVEVECSQSDSSSTSPPPKPELGFVSRTNSGAAHHKRVKFAVVTTSFEGIRAPKANRRDDKTPNVISDMCATLAAKGIPSKLNDPLGLLEDELDPNCQHKLFLKDNMALNGDWQSVSELLEVNLDPSASHSRFQSQLDRRERLRLAVSLACNVLQFHGSWLKTDWRTEDILFPGRHVSSASRSWPPCLSLRVSEPMSSPNTASNDPSAANNQTIHHLGLALTELSLCQSLADTTTEHLWRVFNESGTRYCDVVRKCLFWEMDSKNARLDDTRFQEAVYTLVVSPLMEELRVFEGIM